MDFHKKLIKRLSISLGIIVILGSLLWGLAKDIQNQARKVVTQRMEILRQSQSLSSLASFKKQFEKAQTLFSILENALPEKDRLLQLSRELEELARQNEVGFSFSFGSEKAGTRTVPGEIEFVMSLSGVFRKILDFLVSLENSNFPISLDSLSFSRDIGSGRITMTIKGRIFFRQ